MTKCPLERPSLGEDASRHGQLSVRGKRVVDCLLVLLPTHLHSASRVSPFPSALLSSICDALQRARADGPNEQHETSILPPVLGKLRDWRLVDPEYRHSPGGLHSLALDLAGIVDASTASTSSDRHHARLRMKWVSSESPSESQSLPSRFGVLDLAHRCADVLPDLDDALCQVGRLGTPDSEDASAVASRRLHSVSGFRSGCSACRHPRMSSPSTPQRATLGQRTPFGDLNQFESTVQSPRHPTSVTVQRTPIEKRRREKDKVSKSVSRSSALRVDENERPRSRSTGVEQAIGVSFPRQRTLHPRISNADPAASVERRVGPSPFRTCDKQQTSRSHRAVASVDLRLPPTDPSPVDLRPTRAQSVSYSPVRSHGLGSVQKLSSNAAGSRWSRRLPSWTRTHPTTTTTASCGKPTPSSPAKANVQKSLLTRLRPSGTLIPPMVLPSDMKRRDRPRTHKHTQSDGSLFLP